MRSAVLLCPLVKSPNARGVIYDKKKLPLKYFVPLPKRNMNGNIQLVGGGKEHTTIIGWGMVRDTFMEEWSCRLLFITT